MGDAGWQSLLADTKAGYAAAGVELTDAQVEKEALANWVGQNLFKDGITQAVVSGDATTGNLFLQVIDKVRRATMSQKNNPSASDVAMLERLFIQAEENKQGAHGRRGGAGAGGADHCARPGGGTVCLLIPHSTRHTFVSQTQALGVDLATIQSIVGHADLDMTQHYLHVQEDVRLGVAKKFSDAFPVGDINGVDY